MLLPTITLNPSENSTTMHVKHTGYGPYTHTISIQPQSLLPQLLGMMMIESVSKEILIGILTQIPLPTQGLTTLNHVMTTTRRTC